MMYRLSDFTPAPPENASPAAGQGKPQIERLEPVLMADPAELEQWGVGNDLKTVIIYGDDPDDPARWNGDRSAALFWVCCELYRLGVPSERIVGIIVDDKWDISAHVLDKGRRNVLDYAWRQFDRAKADVDAKGANQWPMRDLAKAIEWMNARYFAALEGTDYTFFREDADQVQPMKPSGFHFELADKDVIVVGSNKDEKRYPISKLWCSDSRRRVYPR